MHNEIIIGLIFTGFNHWINLDAVIKKSHAEMADPRWLGSPLATLFKYACETGLPEGETVLTALDLPATQPKPFLAPLAFADFYTLCKARSKSEFSEIFGGELPMPWIDLYWDTVRDRVKKAMIGEDGNIIGGINESIQITHLIGRILNMYDKKEKDSISSTHPE